MRIRFDATLADAEIENPFQQIQPLDNDAIRKALLDLADDRGVFMLYWYAGLYVVIEGFQKLKLHDPKIDPLLQSPNVAALKKVRHATFHFQKEFVSPKIYPFLQGKDSVPWVRSLTEAFSELFLREVPKL
ncbi:MAG: hypothetical protein WA849_09965 [Candidatus Udaeobacter sp.]